MCWAPMACWCMPGDQGSAAGSTDTGRRKHACKPHAIGGKPVYVGRSRQRITIGANARSKILNHHKHDVRLRHAVRQHLAGQRQRTCGRATIGATSSVGAPRPLAARLNSGVPIRGRMKTVVRVQKHIGIRPTQRVRRFRVSETPTDRRSAATVRSRTVCALTDIQLCCPRQSFPWPATKRVERIEDVRSRHLRSSRQCGRYHVESPRSA